MEITLLDVNDNNPSFVPSNQYSFKTKVDNPLGTIIGKVYIFVVVIIDSNVRVYSFPFLYKINLKMITE